MRISTTKNFKVTVANPTNRSISFGNEEPSLTLTTASAPKTVSSLADVDLTSEESKQSGSTLVYDAESNTYKGEKVFDYDGDEVHLKGGNF